MPSDLEVMNMVGKFSKRNMAALSKLKKSGIEVDYKKKTKKSILEYGTCKAVFDYGSLKTKKNGDCSFIEEFLD